MRVFFFISLLFDRALISAQRYWYAGEGWNKIGGDGNNHNHNNNTGFVSRFPLSESDDAH